MDQDPDFYSHLIETLEKAVCWAEAALDYTWFPDGMPAQSSHLRAVQWECSLQAALRTGDTYPAIYWRILLLRRLSELQHGDEVTPATVQASVDLHGFKFNNCVRVSSFVCLT